MGRNKVGQTNFAPFLPRVLSSIFVRSSEQDLLAGLARKSDQGPALDLDRGEDLAGAVASELEELAAERAHVDLQHVRSAALREPRVRL
jgi:hypothetical protein